MDTSKLVFLLIHGIGQQSEDVQQRFLTRVQAQAEELAGSRFKAGGCGPATGRLPRLVAERADWSRTYRRQKDTWLKVLFANLPPLSRIIFRIAFKVLVLVMVVRALISGGFYVVDYICEIVTGRCLDQCLNGSLLWVIESVLFTVLGALAVYLFAYRFIPWGYLFSLLRGFEAKTLSDVPVYLGRKGEVEIVCKVCSTLLSLHPRPCSFFDYLVDPDNYEFPPPSQRLNLVLAGHSQGSVIAFDMLYGSTQYMLWKAGDYRSEDTPVLRRRINQVQHFIGADRLRSRMLEDRRDCDLILRLLTRSSFHELMEELDLSWEEGQLLYYRLLEFLNQSFNPVGMVTFGSPIPLFIFRDRKSVV